MTTPDHPSLEEVRRHWGLAVDFHRRPEHLAGFDKMIQTVQAQAWSEAYATGIYDEVTSRDNPIDFGFGLQTISPCRVNPYGETFSMGPDPDDAPSDIEQLYRLLDIEADIAEMARHHGSLLGRTMLGLTARSLAESGFEVPGRGDTLIFRRVAGSTAYKLESLDSTIGQLAAEELHHLLDEVKPASGIPSLGDLVLRPVTPINLLHFLPSDTSQARLGWMLEDGQITAELPTDEASGQGPEVLRVSMDALLQINQRL